MASLKYLARSLFVTEYVEPMTMASASGQRLVRSRNLVLFLLFSLMACSERPAATPIASNRVPSEISANEAVNIISQLPEAKAWAKYIDEKSNGVAHAAMLVEPQQPEAIETEKYWSVNYYENQPSHLHRWQTFMVRLDGKEVLVDDVATGEYVSLDEWRENERPIERVSEAKVP